MSDYKLFEGNLIFSVCRILFGVLPSEGSIISLVWELIFGLLLTEGSMTSM